MSANSTYLVAPVDKPRGIAFDYSGNVYVTNNGNNRIIKITPEGIINYYLFSGSLLQNPYGLVCDDDGNIYSANYDINSILKITPSLVSTIFATGISTPGALVFDKYKNLFCTSILGNSLVKITPEGYVTTFVSNIPNPSGLAYDAINEIFYVCSNNGTIYKITELGEITTYISLGLNSPRALIFYLDYLYCADYGSNCISKINSNGEVSVFASNINKPVELAIDKSGIFYCSTDADNLIVQITSNGVSNFQGGLSRPKSIAIDNFGNMYCANSINGTIIKTNETGIVNIIARDVWGGEGLAFDNISKNLYCTNFNRNLISKINSIGEVSFFASIPDAFSLTFDNSQNLYCGTLSNIIYKITSAGEKSIFLESNSGINRPISLVFDNSYENLYCGEEYTNLIKQITPDKVVNIYSGANKPSGLTFGPYGHLYASESTIRKIRQITKFAVRNVYVEDTVGYYPFGLVYNNISNNMYCACFDDNSIMKISPNTVQPFFAGLANPTGVAFDSVGNFYVASGDTILKQTQPGEFSLFANEIPGAKSLAFDSLGNLYCTLYYNAGIAKIKPNGESSVLVYPGKYSSIFSLPSGLAIDSSGTIYCSSYGTDTIVKISSLGVVTTVISTGERSGPNGIVFDSFGDLYCCCSNSNIIIKITSINSNPTITTFATNVGNCQDLRFDNSGNMYCISINKGILKISSNEVIIISQPALSYPTSLTFDNSYSYLYISNTYGNFISKFKLEDRSIVTFMSSLDKTNEIVIDSSNNFYCSNWEKSSITKITSSGISTQLVTSGLHNPWGLMYDNTDNILYCTNVSNATIVKIDPETGNITPFISVGLSGPTGLTYDNTNQIFYCSNWYNSTISKITKSGYVTELVNTGLNQPFGLEYDTTNDILYCANSGNNTIVKIDPISGSVTPFVSSGLDNPRCLKLDILQNLYCSNINNHTISIINSLGNIISVIYGIFNPTGLTINTKYGYLYCVSQYNNIISRIFYSRETLQINLIKTIQDIPFNILTISNITNNIVNKIKKYDSSNTYVGSIDSSGNVTIINEGTTNITAISDIDLPYGVSYLLNLLLNVKTETIMKTPSSFTRGPKDFNRFYIGATSNSPAEIMYSSSNPNIATVNSDGLVTCISGGTVIITVRQNAEYQYNEISKQIPIYIKKIAKITVASSFTKTNKTPFNLAATSTSSSPIIYVSSAPGVASIDSNGNVTIRGSGITTINMSQVANTAFSSATAKTILKIRL